MKRRLYMPDGSYKELGEEKRQQVPDLTPDEYLAANNVMEHLSHKYANKKMKEVFQQLKKEAEHIFEEDFEMAVVVKPLTSADTPVQKQYLEQCKKFGYPAIEIEISHRLNWQEGDHSKELWEWKHRKDHKHRAITSKKLLKWLY